MGGPEIKKILQLKHIAIVGLSKDPAKDSNKVGLYLKTHGYQIVPVNPTAEQVLNEISFPSLREIPAHIAAEIEAVDVFRPSGETLEILLQTVKLRGAFGNVKAFWLQEGIKNPATEKLAKKAGLLFVQDKCMMKEHKRLFGKKMPKKAAKK